MAKNFTLPPPAQLTEIRRELKLNAAQARELELVIRHAHEDLEGYYRSRIGRTPRKARMDRLTAVDQAIGKLSSLLEKKLEFINDDLPFHAREAIAWCASSQLISAITGEEVSRRGTRIAHKEQSIGLHHGARIFAAQLRLIREPIQNVLAEKSADPGGLEPSHARVMLIRALAAAAPAIIGNRATGTAGGDFERLVAAVFRAVGINADDAGKAIERILYPKPSRPKVRK